MEFTNNHTQDSKLWTDLAFGRKFRPLVPKPICSSKIHTPYSSALSNPCHCYMCQNPSFPSWNTHPLLSDIMSSDYGSNNKKFMSNMPLVSTRWNPTPEQLESLEEMYKRGIRTPTAEQIQQIAAKLRRFGKIEGKNVFYWFQNHKARERQKKRRQLELLASGKKKMHRSNHHQTEETKPKGFSKSQMENDNPKKLSVPSNCSSTLPTYHQGSECKQDGWSGLDQNQMEVQQVITKNEPCSWNLELSSGYDTVQVVNAQRSKVNGNVQPLGVEDDQTLDLFPIKNCPELDDGGCRDVSVGGSKFRPNEFIEFLPTRN